MTSLKPLFDFFRKKALPPQRYAHIYSVQVNVDHPRIIGHVARFRVSVDANSKGHARRQIQNELKLIIGDAVIIKK